MGCSTSTLEPAGGGSYPKQQVKVSQQQPAPGYNHQLPPNHGPPHNHGPPCNQTQYSESQTDIQVKPVELNRATLERYVELERQIHGYESRNVQKNLKVKEEELQETSERVKVLQQQYDEAAKQTAKEKQDVDQLQEPSVKSFFKDQQSFDAQMSKEQEEYLDALNKQEIAQKEVEAAVKEKTTLEQEVQALQADNKKLEELFIESDELLAGIFNGSYGSDLEDALESQLDTLLDRKQRISVAKYKWQNSRVLLQYACNQLGFAVKRWQEIASIPGNNIQARYTMATEVRNNLVAANQNITAAQRYLHTITFPYCKPDEMMTLTKATNNIYTDMQTAERHGHAHQCYSVTQKRASALLQWFDHVINGTILVDLERATLSANQKEKELRAERLRLIKIKIQESGGDVSGVDIDADKKMDLGDDKEPEVALMAAAQADAVDNSEDLPGEKASEAQVVDGTQTTQSGAPTPLPSNDLADAPDSNAIFGNIDELKKQHEREQEEFKRAQEVNKARMEQGLEEKLKARRSRRRRQQMQDDNQ